MQRLDKKLEVARSEVIRTSLCVRNAFNCMEIGYPRTFARCSDVAECYRLGANLGGSW